MRRVLSFVRRHPLPFVVLALAGAFGLYWFAPWKLVTSKTVNESAPTIKIESHATLSPGPGFSTMPATTVVSSGSFRSLEHRTTGIARVLRLADGRRVIRFENLSTSDGPDLVVLLSATPATNSDWKAYGKGSPLYLAKLKGNRGNQNYEIPASEDLTKYRSVVIWCRRFTVGFGAAPIVVAA